MGSEIPKEIDPKVLIEQEDLNKGAIKDVELAQAIAEAENKTKVPGYFDEGNVQHYAQMQQITPEQRKLQSADLEAARAALTVLRARVDSLTPGASEEIKTKIAETALQKMSLEQREMLIERKANAEIEADKILQSLRATTYAEEIT